MNRPVMYDTYSCAGGAGFGYDLAGFEVIGIDNRPQPNYPFEFHEADALDVLRAVAEGREPWPGAPPPDAIHASPPCQFKARVTAWRGSREDVFHTLPAVEWYPDWAHLVMAWTPEFAGQAS